MIVFGTCAACGKEATFRLRVTKGFDHAHGYTIMVSEYDWESTCCRAEPVESDNQLRIEEE